MLLVLIFDLDLLALKKPHVNDVREVNVWHVNEFGCGFPLKKKK